MLGTLHISLILHSIHAEKSHTLWLQNEEVENDVSGAMVKGRASSVHIPRLGGGSISALPSGT